MAPLTGPIPEERPWLLRALWRYADADYVTAYKARFIFYFSFACIGVLLVGLAYTLAIQLGDPAGPSLNVPILLTESAGVFLFGGVLALLLRGHFSFAAHGILWLALALVWTVIGLDLTHPVIKLDTIVFVFAVLAMAPLVVHRRASVLVWVALANIPVLLLLLFSQRHRLGLPAAAFYDVIADTSLALVFVCIVIYNTFAINRHALDRLEEDIERRTATEEALRRSQEEASALLRFKNEMLETAAIWITIQDTEGRQLTWNTTAERITGYAKEEVLGHGRVWEW